MPPKKHDKPTTTEEGLAFCNKLFQIEREFHDVTAEERYEGRLLKSRPVLDEFKQWLKYTYTIKLVNTDVNNYYAPLFLKLVYHMLF